MIDFEQLKIESKGKWPSIYYHLGINVGEGKHKPCPNCQGIDRFRFDDRYGMGDYICGQCGAGDGFSLVMKCLSIDFPEALKKIQSIIGGCEKVENQKPKHYSDPKIHLNKLWKDSILLTGSDNISVYLHNRGLTLTPDNIRFCAKCYESGSKKEMPAMIARIQSEDGRPISLHRTYLQGSGKADIESNKKLMPGTEPLNGGAIRLFSSENSLFESGTLGIAEGIETAMSATQLFQIATWAAISTSLMEAWIPPDNIKKIVIFADRDANFAGQKSAYILANKLYNKDFIVEVETPDEVGDWNDVLTGRK